MEQFVLILLFIIIVPISPKITNIQKKILLPPHSFKLELVEGVSYNFLVSWNDQSDLDVDIYKDSPRSLQMSFEQRASFAQSFTYEPDETQYFIIIIKSVIIKQKVVCYSVKVTGDSGQKLFENCIFENHQSNSAFIIGNQTSKVASINYHTSQAIQVYFYCFNNFGPYSGTALQTFSITEECSNRVIVLFQGTLPENLEYYFVVMTVTEFDTSCDSGYIFNTGENKCVKSTNSTNYKIIFIVIGAVGGVGLLMLIIITLCKRFRKNQENQEGEGVRSVCIQTDKGSQQNVKESSQKIKQAQYSTCPICLDDHCDVRLECKHFYHRNCINDWLEKDSHCPLCRQNFRKSKIRIL